MDAGDLQVSDSGAFFDFEEEGTGAGTLPCYCYGVLELLGVLGLVSGGADFEPDFSGDGGRGMGMDSCLRMNDGGGRGGGGRGNVG